MSKRMYNSPKMETAPLHLSACIMSGGDSGNSPSDQGHGSDPSSDAFGAPRRRVF